MRRRGEKRTSLTSCASEDFSEWTPRGTCDPAERRTRQRDRPAEVEQRLPGDERWSCPTMYWCWHCSSSASSDSFEIVRENLVSRESRPSARSSPDSTAELSPASSPSSSTSKDQPERRVTSEKRRAPLTAATEPLAINSSMRCWRLSDISAHLSMIFCSHLKTKTSGHSVIEVLILPMFFEFLLLVLLDQVDVGVLGDEQLSQGVF